MELPGVEFLRQNAGDVVDLGYAKYLGNRSFPNTVAFLGLPYAEPPLGDRRFRAPLPLNESRVTEEAGGQAVDATQNPDFCVQGPIGGEYFYLICCDLSHTNYQGMTWEALEPRIA